VPAIAGRLDADGKLEIITITCPYLILLTLALFRPSHHDYYVPSKNSPDPTRHRSTGQIHSLMATSLQRYRRMKCRLGGGPMASRLIPKKAHLIYSGAVEYVL
jgi:hypothetical protein